ncbi:hypothetical protein NBRC116587_19730 [Pseudoteredinibacter isoporae]
MLVRKMKQAIFNWFIGLSFFKSELSRFVERCESDALDSVVIRIWIERNVVYECSINQAIGYAEYMHSPWIVDRSIGVCGKSAQLQIGISGNTKGL